MLESRMGVVEIVSHSILTCQQSKETLENPSHLRENSREIAGADWFHGQQAARIWRLRAGHGLEAHPTRALSGRDGEGGAMESAD
jgi:hypothetical protein